MGRLVEAVLHGDVVLDSWARQTTLGFSDGLRGQYVVRPHSCKGVYLTDDADDSVVGWRETSRARRCSTAGREGDRTPNAGPPPPHACRPSSEGVWHGANLGRDRRRRSSCERPSPDRAWPWGNTAVHVLVVCSTRVSCLRVAFLFLVCVAHNIT